MGEGNLCAVKSSDMCPGGIFLIAPFSSNLGVCATFVAGDCETVILLGNGNLDICATNSRVAYNTSGRTWIISCMLHNDKFYAILPRLLYVAYGEFIARVGTFLSDGDARASLAGIPSHLVLCISRPTVSKRVLFCQCYI